MGCEDVCTRIFSPVTCGRPGAPEIFSRADVNRCYTSRYGPVQLAVAGKTAAVNVRAFTPAEAIQKIASGPAEFRELWERALGEQTRSSSFFGFNVPTSTLAVLSKIVEAGLGVAAAATGVGAVYAVGRTAAYQVERSQQAMGLDLGQLIGGISGVVGGLGGTFQNPYLQGFGQIGGAFASAVQRQPTSQVPSPVYAAGPVYGPMNYPQQYPVVRTQAPQVAGTAVTILATRMAVVKEILAKIAAGLGKKGITLSRVIDLAKKLGAYFVSREAIALYLGITVDELATLFIAHHTKKHRRMNPANARALRRSMRRLRSFDRLASRVSARLSGRARSVGRRKRRACAVCRSSPCTC